MNSRSLLRRPTGPEAGILRCHVMNSRALLRKTQEVPKSPGAFLVHFWCTLGALLVHFRCTSGALSVHSKRFPERELLRFRKEASILRTETFGSPFRHLQTRKGIAPLPKGSLDPMHRNVWILPTCKPERELPRFRKEVLILRTETFGSHSVKARANDPPHENRLDRPRNYHILIERGVTTTRPQQNTPQTLPTERSMNGPGAHPAQRAAGNLSLREYSDVHTQNCTCGT